MEIRDSASLGSVSETVRLSMLYPRPENRPITRARTPGSLSTRTDIMCRSITLVSFMMRSLRQPVGPGRSDQHHSFLGHRLFRLVFRAEQHIIMRRARRDHREAVLFLGDTDISNHRPGRIQHLGDHIVKLVA